jgi:hypothetical protein
MVANKKVDPFSLPARDCEVLVTPAIAAAWLDRYNDCNRPVSQNHLEVLTYAAKNGKWQNYMPLIFAVGGSMLDGQHRLLAVIASGVAIRMLVWVNRPESLRAVIDQKSRAKTPADYLHMSGMAYAQFTSSTCTMKRRIDLGGLWANGRSSPSTADDVHAYVEKNAEVLEAVPWVANHKTVWKLYKSPTTPSVCFSAFLHLNKKKARDFFAALNDGVASSADDPVAALRHYLFHFDKGLNSHTAQALKVVATYKAFRAFLRGDKLRRLTVRRGEPLPKLTRGDVSAGFSPG